jgi:hypothetical protein
VYLESHAGYLTAIKHDSVVSVDEVSVTTEGGKVKEEKTLLDLKSGNLVAKLDPTKKAVNNYQVRTPKGVAAARGTTFTIQYKGQTITVAVVNGAVSLNAGGTYGNTLAQVAGNASNQAILAGQVLRSASDSRGGAGIGGRAVTTAFAESADRIQDVANEINELLATVVASVAVAAQTGLGGTTLAEAQAVARAVLTAAPGATAQAAAMIKQSTQGEDNTAVVNAIREVVPAAQQGAFDQSVQSGTFEQPTVNIRTQTMTTTTTTPQEIDPATISRSND